MTGVVEMLALAARCEAATGPLAEEVALKSIDEAWMLLNPRPAPWRVSRQANGEPWGGDGLGPYTPEATAWNAKHRSFKLLIDAGASLDAALTLVPEGYLAATVNWSRIGSGVAEVYLGNPGPMFDSEAATPALALTAAALKARAQKEPTS